MTDQESLKPQASGEREVTFLDVLIVIAKHKTLVLGITLTAGVLSAIISLLIPNVYTGTTKILPPQQMPATPAVLAQLGNLAGLVGSTASGLKNPSDLYVGMLKSRTIADALIQRFKLNDIYRTRYQSQTRDELTMSTTIGSGKDGIITIEVDDQDPKRAAELANGYVEELFKLTKVLALTEASQRRLFFQRQFEESQGNLANAERAARDALEKGGIVEVEGQGRVMVEIIARLRAQITVKEVEIGAMRAFATAQNPELQRNLQEVEVMKRELARLEGTAGGRLSTPKVVDQQGMDNLGLLRNLKYHEATYELLAKQLEMAKIDEAKDSTLIQVLDPAVEPDRKSKPRRTLIVLLCTAGALFLSVLGALAKEATARAKNDPQQSQRLRQLTQYLGVRRRP